LKKPEETDIDRLRSETQKSLSEAERRIALLEGQVKKIIGRLNSGPGVCIG
jgi:hypothetical protein